MNKETNKKKNINEFKLNWFWYRYTLCTSQFFFYFPSYLVVPYNHKQLIYYQRIKSKR